MPSIKGLKAKENFQIANTTFRTSGGGYVFTFPPNDGDPNFVLVTDGFGNTTWNPPTQTASSSVAGIVKTNTSVVDPVVYLKSEVDDLLSNKANISGTGSSVFDIGTSAVSGAKSVRFVNSAIGVLSWNPTSNRSISLPDSSGVIALRDVPQSFSARQSSSRILASVSGTYNIDLNLSNCFDLTLTGNTSFTVSNIPSASFTTYTFFFRQDSTGGRTVTLSSDFRPPKGKTITYNTTANEKTIVNGICDGSIIHIVGESWQ